MSSTKNFFEKLVFSGLLSMLPVITLAQPFISDISTTNLVQGTKVTITGGNFGEKNPAAPIYWADFESGINPSQLGQKTSWDSYNRNMSLTNARTHVNSTRSVRWNAGSDIGDRSDPRRSDTGHFLMTGEFPRVYIYVNRFYDYNVGSFNMNHKIWRFWNTTNGYSNNIRTGYSGSSGNTGAEYTGLTGSGLDKHPKAIANSEWLTQEVIYKAGDINVANGLFTYIENGLYIGNKSDYRMRTSSYPGTYDYFFIQDDISNEASFKDNLWIYYDDVYMDNTWARVMIGDAPTWEASRNRAVQIPSQWSNTSITFTVNKGQFTNINTGYLYVFDADGNVNSNGMPLCTDCPKTPSNLTVN